MSLDGQEEEKVDIKTKISTPPNINGDATPPDTTTVGGHPTPSGGGIPEAAVDDINEMGFSMDAEAAGMDFGMDMDMNMAMDMDMSEVAQLAGDIMEDTSIGDELPLEQQEEIQQTQEDIDSQT